MSPRKMAKQAAGHYADTMLIYTQSNAVVWTFRSAVMWSAVRRFLEGALDGSERAFKR